MTISAINGGYSRVMPANAINARLSGNVPEIVKPASRVSNPHIQPEKQDSKETQYKSGIFSIKPDSGSGFAAVYVNSHGDRFEISKEAYNYLEKKASEKNGTLSDADEYSLGKLKTGETDNNGECEECTSRRYVDGSDDPSVSYQTPTKINRAGAAAAVAAHENEHAVNEKRNAEREGRVVIKQTTTIKHAICPECGKPYVDGGVSRTTTAGKPEMPESQYEKDNVNKTEQMRKVV